LLGALSVACGPQPSTETIIIEDEDDMTIAPWHMWGGVAQVNASTLSPGLLYTTTGQLTRIEYKRPESWRFLFFVQVFRSQLTNPSILQVDFTVQTGVG